MMRRILGAIVIAAVSGCASAPRNDADELARRTTVTVDNQSFSDMTVYVTRGQRVRLGTATGKAKTVFTIPRSLVIGTSTLRFIADPVGSSRQSVSEEITVSEGDEVGLMIPPP